MAYFKKNYFFEKIVCLYVRLQYMSILDHVPFFRHLVSVIPSVLVDLSQT